MKSFTIYIGDKSYTSEPGLHKGSDLLQLAGIEEPQQLVIRREGALDIPIGKDDYIVVQDGMHFDVGSGAHSIPDNPCLRVPIPICLNNVTGPELVFNTAKMTGSELKRHAADCEPADGLFVEVDGGADEFIEDDMRIILLPHNKFITAPCGNVGEETKSPVVQSLDDQIAELQQHYPNIELHQAGNNHILVVRDFPLPHGWSQVRTNILLEIPSSYPFAALDMFWVFPEIKLENGAYPEKGDHFNEYMGNRWQRFSWHYPTNRPWQPTGSSLLTHIRFCLNRLNQIK